MEPQKKLGIYIDVSNIELGLADYNCEGMCLDYSQLIRQVSQGYSLTVLRGYDSYVKEGQSLTDIQQVLKNAGVELVLYESQRGNNRFGECEIHQKEVDTGLVADVCWDLASGTVDSAIIVSGDRDMRPAYARAKKAGCEVKILTLRCAIQDNYYLSLDDCLLIEDYEAFLLSGEVKDGVCFNVASFPIMEGVKADE